MRQEWLARIFIGVLLAAAIGIPAAAWQRSQGIVIHARMAETGGWTPENLTVQVGEPLHLRLTSDDVTHSFAIGQSDQAPLDVIPGEMTEVTLVFDQPGKYTFYCTRWCSLNHWRMRGVIEVTSSQTASAPEIVFPPLYITLGLDIDAARQSEVIPDQIPSAIRGAQLDALVPPVYRSREYYQTHTPEQLWLSLRGDAAFQGLADQQLWDLVAWIWQMNIPSQELVVGEQLYTANCAACHGEQGRGDGVFATQLEQPNLLMTDAMLTGETTVRPVDFTDAARMLATSPAHLQGKIIRGGMGTGMPYWGPIFTTEQSWSLVAYLWTFLFEMEKP